MDLLSPWKTKKIFPCYFLIFCIIMGCLFLSGCDPTDGKYPWQVAEKWVCTDPPVTFISEQLPDKTWNFVGQLEWEDQMFNVDIHYRANLFTIIPAGAVSFDDELLSGTWRYYNGNLILTIEEDFLFDGAYSALVFQQG